MNSINSSFVARGRTNDCVSEPGGFIIVSKGEERPTALHTQYYITLHYTTNILLKTTEEDPSWSKNKK